MKKKMKKKIKKKNEKKNEEKVNIFEIPSETLGFIVVPTHSLGTLNNIVN
jgi:hypothetical protein